MKNIVLSPMGPEMTDFAIYGNSKLYTVVPHVPVIASNFLAEWMVLKCIDRCISVCLKFAEF